MNPLEHVGALYIETQRLLGEYGKLLGLLQQAKDGEVQLDQIEIDHANSSWAIKMDGKQFAAAVSPETTDEPTE